MVSKISFSVIMPTYNGKAFIRNAIRSLFAQTFPKWELIIVDDGSSDGTKEYISDYLSDARVTYIRNNSNMGLGAAVNRGLEIAKYDYIAYLPSDDFFFSNHLKVMHDTLIGNRECVLAYSRMRSEIFDSLIGKKNDDINGLVYGQSLQMVQTVHKKTSDRWVERNEYVSEDLYKTFWFKLTTRGFFLFVDKETCNWTMHAAQRHNLIFEMAGGNINRYRLFYNVKTPIKLKVSQHKFVDEEKQFSPYRKSYYSKPGGLKILLVGELSYNPERIVAFEEDGHKLYGLWTTNPFYSFNNVGHLPFGNVEDLDSNDIENEIKRICPDVIYALLNVASVNIAHQVLKLGLDIPFIWHFKEGPFLCFEHGLWGKLIDLYTLSDGVIYLNDVTRKWYEQYIPSRNNYLLLDGDLPKKEIFGNVFSEKLSTKDGEIHTVVAGRMVGMELNLFRELAKNKIHVHLYNESYEDGYKEYISEIKKVAGNYFHQHANCAPINWTIEFSKYDAGWLHCFDSTNGGDYSKMGWNDLNIPARVSTMMAAGIPCIEKDNGGNIVAMQDCLKNNGCAIFYADYSDLISKLQNRQFMMNIQNNIMMHRMEYAFDTHVPTLINFFKKLINDKKYAIHTSIS